MKRLFTLLLCLVMALSLIPAAAAEDIEIVEIDPVGVGVSPWPDPIDEELIEIIDPEEPAEAISNAKPTITSQPKSVTAYVGTTATFTVTVSDAAAFAYQWYYRTSSSGSWTKSSASGARTTTLSISAEMKRNGYQYRCKLTDLYGDYEDAYTKSATLTVTEKPVVTTQPESKSALAGTTVNFSVKADGAESYQWYYRKSSSGTWAKSTLTGSKTATLRVKATAARNGFQYRCKVTNSVGSSYSDAATLGVSLTPVVTTQPLSYTAGAGATIYFKVEATGAESYQWYYRKSSSGSWAKSTLTGSKTATLTVKATEARDGYQYCCRVKNSAGSKYTKAATLYVFPDQCGNGLTWKLSSSGLLTISGTGNMYDFSDLDDIPWYSVHEQIKRISIGSSVTSVGESAFYDCTGLTNVTIPDSVTSIGGSAFCFCTGLTSVTIPSSVTSIGEDVFIDCIALTSVTIPSGVTSVEDFAFLGCISLKSVTIPDSVRSIGYSSFSDCSSLTTITIPAGVNSIASSSFLGCSSLTKIAVDNNNNSYSSKDGVLFNKNKTELFIFPGGKSGAYTIPDGVSSIGEYAFYKCSKLTSLKISASVKSIDRRSLSYCSSITEFVVESGNSCYSSKDGILFNKNKTELIQYPLGKSSSSYSIPTSVKTIKFGAFDSSNLTSITIPDSVITVEAWAFICCKNLESVTMGNGVSEIQHNAFNGCTSLSDIYYNGTRIQRSQITIESLGNDPLYSAMWHYNA